MPKSSSAIFFDWNGTLLADSHFCWRATNVALGIFNQPKVSLEEYRSRWALPISRLYQNLGCNTKDLFERQKELYTAWEAVYQPSAEGARLRRGAHSVLETLNAHQHDVLILSNHTVGHITNHLQRLGAYHHFSAILANDKHRTNFLNNKKAERLQKYVKNNGVKKAIIVGDTEEEIELAREHGLVSVSITDGQCSTKRLRAAKPDFLIRSLSEIPPIAQRVFSSSRRGQR